MSVNIEEAKTGPLSCPYGDGGRRLFSADFIRLWRRARRLCCAAAILMACSSAAPVLAEVPADVSFTATYVSSAALSWTLDTPGTEQPLMVLSTAADFSVAFSSATGELAAETTVYYGLTPNATYFFKVKVSTELDSSYSASVSTITDPNPPADPLVTGVFLSSVTISWTGNGNAADTVYFAETAQDEGFTAAVVSTLTTLGAFAFEDLVRNTTYYIRARAMGFSEVQSLPVNFGSTITLSAPPLAPDYTAVYSTAAELAWGENGNAGDTSYSVQVSSNDFQSVDYSSSCVGPAFTAYGLIPDSTYYFKVASLNSAGMESAYAVFAATSTHANTPSLDPVATFPGGEGVIGWNVPDGENSLFD